MSLSPHEVLAKLAGNARSKAEEAINSMAAQRQQLHAERDRSVAYLAQLGKQHEQALKGGTKASMLLMIEAGMAEQQMNIEGVRIGLQLLHEQEQALIQQWIDANQKNKIHEKMQGASEKKEQRLQDRRAQQRLDDMCAASNRQKLGTL